MWFDEMRQGLQQTTIETYQTNIDKYIIPYFTKTGITLTDMSYRDVKNYYNHYSETLSTSSLKRHHAIIRPALSQAVREGLIASNPAAEIRFPKSDNFVGQFLSVAEGNNLLRAATGTPLEPVVRLCMILGLRRSEAAGLKWEAVDFDEDCLTVRHTRIRVKTEVAKDKTKNKSSHRHIPLTPLMRDYLLRLRARQSEDKLLLGAAYLDTPYVCRWPDGHALRPDYMSEAFANLLRKNGLRHVRLHDLRHSAASYALKSGASLKEIQELLGHADLASTNVYTHLDDESKRKTTGRIADLLTAAQ